MHVIEDPIATRQSVGKILSFGAPTTEAPLRTLRRHAALSDGASVPLRNPNGRLLGRLHLYSSLNTDAARLFRRRDHPAAARLAKRAHQVEQSAAARHVIRAIERIASQVPVDAWDVRRTDPAAQRFRAYMDMRGAASWEAVEQPVLWRSWVSEPQTWLGDEGGGELRAAMGELASRVAKARSEEPALVRLTESGAITTRIGIVERLDPVVAELLSPDGTRFIVPRRDLEREGLAVVGQAVTALREEIPDGPVLDFYAAAARLDVVSEVDDLDPFGPPAMVRLDEGESAWLERVIASEPRTVPIIPLPFAQDGP